jgi:glycosyltransferase involved in cell wall biosynthesis
VKNIMVEKSVDVIQIGAREHYALPLMMNHLGLLRYLHTDFYVHDPGLLLNLIDIFPIPHRVYLLIKKMMSRTSPLPKSRVKRHIIFGLQTAIQGVKIKGASDRSVYFSEQSEAFERVVHCDLRKPADVTVGFRGVLPIFENLEGRSFRILWQNDGGWYEVELMKQVLNENPMWVGAQSIEQTYSSGSFKWLEVEKDRLSREWAASDLIVCNSEWTKKCLLNSGVPEQKMLIIPISYLFNKNNSSQVTTRPNDTNKFTVGFLGTLTLRKGIHVLLEAVNSLGTNGRIKVKCAGTLKISRDKLSEYEHFTEYLGILPRSDIDEFFDDIDILVLPSFSEGFGIVQLEAMSRGIPVISSYNCGDVVIPGKNGMRVEAGSVPELAQAIDYLSSNPDVLNDMSLNALSTAGQYHPDIISKRWVEILQSIKD